VHAIGQAPPRCPTRSASAQDNFGDKRQFWLRWSERMAFIETVHGRRRPIIPPALACFFRSAGNELGDPAASAALLDSSKHETFASVSSRQRPSGAASGRTRGGFS
jgi:hypothetical protein